MKLKTLVFLLMIAFVAFVAYTRRPIPTIKESPKPKPFITYSAPAIAKKSQYLLVMVGDSMTLALGPHGGSFNQFLNDKYKSVGSFVEIDNYARASTNVLSLNEAMTTETKSFDVTFPPLLGRDFDLILIESFGYNPLSQFTRDEGLKRQTDKLNEIMTLIKNEHPNSAVVFVATIAPNKERYASPVAPGDSIANRTKEVEERDAYIENHIAYAKEHNIPVIDVYHDSMTPSGDGNTIYINPDDYIHPSGKGIDFIGTKIANFIWDNNILPHS